jgi:hypothetical protein
MNKMTISELKRKASDIFSFIFVSCPNFPPETKTTTAREFDELAELIQAIMEGIRNDEGKQWLRICLQEVRESRKHYEEADRKQGRYVIQRAEEHFKQAFTKKPTSARFVIGDSGGVHDTESGFPE